MNILITGAGRGLGSRLCEQAALRGHTVLAGFRAGSPKSAELARLQQTFPAQIILLPLDVADEASVEEAAALAAKSLDRLDAVVNNAGILLAREQKLEQLDFAAVEESFRINLFGPMKVLKHFLPLLQRGDRQVVINVSSEAGSFAGAYGGDYPYALAKAGLNYFSAQLRKELGTGGIWVYAVHPGWIRTDMGGKQAPGDPEATAAGIMDLVERKQGGAAETPVFIDFRGQPMPF